MLNGDILADFLKKRGFSTLCHVNTAATSLTFLRNGGLLSRQYIEDHAMTCFQTMQKSDDKDKEFGIFNDIFFDVKNIWKYRGICFYGPVNFIYSLDVLRKNMNINVTKSNPQNWNRSSEYFNNFAEIENAHEVNNYWPIHEHIVFHNQGSIDFSCLEKVVFYLPFPGTNMSGVDTRNNSDDACRDIKLECNSLGISFESDYIDPSYWRKVSTAKFYGFRGAVPQPQRRI